MSETKPVKKTDSPSVTAGVTDSSESLIVHKVQTQDASGKFVEIIHGPMPVSEWAEYEKANGL